MHDEKTMELLIHQYYPYVVKIAHRYKKYIELDDAIQEGLMGLMEAHNKFNKEKKTKFITYATFWIKNRIIRSIENNTQLIRVPSYIYQLRRDIKKIAIAHPEYTDEQIAKTLNVTIQTLEHARRMYKTLLFDENMDLNYSDPHEEWLKE